MSGRADANKRQCAHHGGFNLTAAAFVFCRLLGCGRDERRRGKQLANITSRQLERVLSFQFSLAGADAGQLGESEPSKSIAGGLLLAFQ